MDSGGSIQKIVILPRIKALLLRAYLARLLSFQVTEQIAARLRRFRQFREG